MELKKLVYKYLDSTYIIVNGFPVKRNSTDDLFWILSIKSELISVFGTDKAKDIGFNWLIDNGVDITKEKWETSLTSIIEKLKKNLSLKYAIGSDITLDLNLLK